LLEQFIKTKTSQQGCCEVFFAGCCIISPGRGEGKLKKKGSFVDDGIQTIALLVVNKLEKKYLSSIYINLGFNISHGILNKAFIVDVFLIVEFINFHRRIYFNFNLKPSFEQIGHRPSFTTDM
jgi:hypothetical protein